MNRKLSDRLGATKDESGKTAPSDGHDLTTFSPSKNGEPLIQRCVIVQRDEKGYGLTVSGESPVYVQSVKENGAAARAGVCQEDRIIKVNGTLVSNSNHIEVVKLIKSGPFVALTLLGRPPGQGQGHGPGQGPNKPLPPEPTSVESPATSPHSNMITAPRPVDDAGKDMILYSKIDILRKMREKQLEIFKKLHGEYHEDPNDLTMHKITEQQKMLKKLDEELYQLTGNSAWLDQSLQFQFSPKHPTQTEFFDRSVDKENSEHSLNMDSFVNATSPRPWQPPKASHRKTNSIPESYYTPEEPHQDVRVERSASDANSKQTQMSNSGTFPQMSSMDHSKHSFTSSLPSNMYGSTSSPTSSPVPMQNDMSHQHDKTWDEVREINERMNTSSSANSYSDSGTPKPGSPALSASPPIGSMMQHISPKQVDVICMEDEDFTSDDGENVDERRISAFNSPSTLEGRILKAIEDHGPFSDINLLKTKPAHLAVFLHYLISNSDPCPLFFNLVTESFSQAPGKSSEMRKWAYEIHSTFLVPEAPLKMPVARDVFNEIDTYLNKSEIKHDKEDMSNIFERARKTSYKMVIEDLMEFRKMGDLGLGSLYGAHELQDGNMDRFAELKIVEKYLLPHLERLIDDNTVDRSQAMASALTTFLRSVGVTKVITAGSNSNLLERCPSFVNTKDSRRKIFTKRSKVSKVKTQIIKGHSFMSQNYQQTTFCNHCTAIIWGIGQQGFQCTNCKFNCHKQCLDIVEENCVGPKKNRDKKNRMSTALSQISSSLISRDSKEEQPAHSPSPYDKSQSHFHMPVTEEEDDSKNKSYVTKTISRFEEKSKETNDRHSPPPSPRQSSPERDKNNTKVKRSESLSDKSAIERKPSIKKKRHTKSDVDKDQGALDAVLIDQAGGSTSSSTTSQRSLGIQESPVNSADDFSNSASPGLFRYDDSDMEVEPEMPQLSAIIPQDILKKLKPKEKKRQEVINELIYTEKTHVRNLKVMEKIFYRPMILDAHITYDLVKLLFPNLDEMLSIHVKLNKAMKALRKENPVVEQVADVLLQSFDGIDGEKFKQGASMFIQNQTYALDYFKSRVKKEAKLASFLNEAESQPVCRRLQLKDMLPTCMHRLTKYPLLIENLLKYTSISMDEHEKLKKCLECAKAILVHVNQAAKECDNKNRLADFQRRMDKKPIENSSNPVVEEFKNLDLTKHSIIYDGPLTWRMGRQRMIQLHVILFEDILVLLQKQEQEKLILRCQSQTVVEGRMDTKFTHSPIIKLTNLLTRDVATDKKAFFLVSTSTMGPQIYELVAASSAERRKWFKYISEAAEAYKGRDAPRLQRRNTRPAPAPNNIAAVPHEVDEEQESEKETETKEDTKKIPDDLETTLRPKLSLSTESLDSIDKQDVPEIVHVVEESPLILPSEVTVAPSIITRADSVSLSPIEQCKRKDEVIKNAIQEKQKLVARILGVPPDDFDNVAEVATVMSEKSNPEKVDPKELVMSSIYQTGQLTSLLNESQPPNEQGPYQKVNQMMSIVANIGSNLTGLLDYLTSQGEQAKHDRTRSERVELAELQQGLERTQRQLQQLKMDKEMMFSSSVSAQRLQTSSVSSQSERSNSFRSRPNSYLSVESSTSERGGETSDDYARLSDKDDLDPDSATLVNEGTDTEETMTIITSDEVITTEVVQPDTVISPDDITSVSPNIHSAVDAEESDSANDESVTKENDVKNTEKALGDDESRSENERAEKSDDKVNETKVEGTNDETGDDSESSIEDLSAESKTENNLEVEGKKIDDSNTINENEDDNGGDNSEDEQEIMIDSSLLPDDSPLADDSQFKNVSSTKNSNGSHGEGDTDAVRPITDHTDHTCTADLTEIVSNNTDSNGVIGAIF